MNQSFLVVSILQHCQDYASWFVADHWSLNVVPEQNHFYELKIVKNFPLYRVFIRTHLEYAKQASPHSLPRLPGARKCSLNFVMGLRHVLYETAQRLRFFSLFHRRIHGDLICMLIEKELWVFKGDNCISPTYSTQPHF